MTVRHDSCHLTTRCIGRARERLGLPTAVPRALVSVDVRRHRRSTSRIGLMPLEPDCERLVAYFERRTPWDS